MSEKKLKEFNDKYGEKIRLLKSIGIMPFGFDPGFLVMVNDQSVDLPLKLVDIICGLIKKVNSQLGKGVFDNFVKASLVL